MKGLNKVIDTYEDALDGLMDGMTILLGGFGICGIPENLIHHVARAGVSNLTIVSNDCGIEGFGLSRLLENGQISKLISSYVGSNSLVAKKWFEGEIEVELCPQGTLAERIRAGGAGIPAFYTPTAAGTSTSEGKPVKVFDGRAYILETAIKGDFSFVKGWKIDTFGNVIYRHTAMNFNPMVATASKITVVEAEKLHPAGAFDPNCVHTPSIYVDRVITGQFEKRIEFRTIN